MTIFTFLGKKTEKEICPGLHASHRFMCMSSNAQAASNLAQSSTNNSQNHNYIHNIHLIFYCPLPLIQMLCAVLLAFTKWTPRAQWGKFSPNMGLRSDLKQDSVPVFCVCWGFSLHICWHFFIWFDLACQTSAAGIWFSLQQVYLLEGVSLSDDTLFFISDQRNGCKYFSTLQYFLTTENNEGLPISWKTHFIS